MLLNVLFQLTAASALCCIYMVMALNCEDSVCSSRGSSNSNNNDDNVIVRQQRRHKQQQQQFDDEQKEQQQVAQQLRGQLRLKLQQQQTQEQQQQHGQQQYGQQQFDPFDFANLRRLQQVNGYYDNNNNNDLQRDPDTKTNSNSNSNNNHNDNNASYYYYKHGNGNGNGNGNSYNNNHNKINNNANPSKSHSSNAHDAGETHPDARNGNHLPFSALNEPVGSASNALHTKNYNNNNNNNRNDDDNNGHSIALRNRSFIDDGFSGADSSASVSFGMTDSEFYQDDDSDADVNPQLNADDELSMNLPYGIQNVRKRMVRGSPSENRGRSTTYQSLCPTKRISIPLETVGYEYRPNHYIEVTCAHNYAPTHNYDFNKNKICSEAGFSCIQLNRTIHFIRRNKAATVECWESEIRIVPSGCECMWPKHSYGDIVAYHETQKRYGGQSNGRPSDYRTGGSYLQIPKEVELIGIDGRRREETEGVGFEAYDFN